MRIGRGLAKEDKDSRSAAPILGEKQGLGLVSIIRDVGFIKIYFVLTLF